MQIKINEKTFNLLSASGGMEMLRDFRRDVITMMIESTYDEISVLFVDGATFTIIEDYGEGQISEFEYTDHGVAGPITDNRNGTVVVKMGKNNTAEQDAQERENQLKENIALIAGEAVDTNEEAKLVRMQIETTFNAAIMTADERITNRNLAPMWVKGRHTVDEVYRTSEDAIWKCRQEYDNDIYPDIVPENETWFTFNIPFHGTTPETALPFILPKEAESRYKNGEYMIWTDRDIYKCIRDTAYGPQDDSSAWEKYVSD